MEIKLTDMNEVNFSAEEWEVIKKALSFEFSGDRETAEKIIRKIDILLKDPGDEGGYIGVELGD